MINKKFALSISLLALAAIGSVAEAQTCRVTTQNGNGARFYVPSGGDGRYNILGWGNGTGGNAATYSGLLTAAAQRCVLVAAATTANSGTGTQIRDAVNQARARFGNILNANLRVCTSGHSQGGSGSFNAANLLGAQCVIAVQPDTNITATIRQRLAANVDATCIFSTADVLAPASTNAANCRRNATIYRQVTTAGTHFAPIGGTGGQPGQAQRAAIDRLLR